MASSQTSAVALVLDRPNQADPAKALPSVTTTASTSFWREFVRVQSDKFILLVLIFGLLGIHQTDLAKIAVGGLIVLIQGQRFKHG